MKRLLAVIAGVAGKRAMNWIEKWVKKAAVRRQLVTDRNAFGHLDASAVRDLGMSRSEFHSHWAESQGLAPRTRVRVEP